MATPAATTKARIGAQVGDTRGTGPAAAGFSIQIKFNRLPAYAEGMGRRVRKDSFRFGERIREGLRNKMREPKHGRIYKIKGRTHVASAAGEAPARLSGETYRSIQVRSIGRGATVEVTVGGAGKYLQHGTSRMAPRWMLIEETREQLPVFQREIKASVRFQDG